MLGGGENDPPLGRTVCTKNSNVSSDTRAVPTGRPRNAPSAAKSCFGPTEIELKK